MVPRWSEVQRFMKYALTGVLNTALTYLVYAVLVHLQVPAGVALAIGYVCGMTTSYLVNSRWTFGQSGWSMHALWRFFVVNLAVLGLSELSLHWILHLIMDPYAAQAVNVVPITVVGFVVNQRFVFWQRPNEEESEVKVVRDQY